jgi:cobalt-zinc-cadmium efflux system membrane fusion protein
MTSRLLPLFGLAWVGLAWLGAAAAADLAVSPQQLDNLGVTLAAPVEVERMPVIEATARVVIPPSREFVITAPSDGLVVRLTAAAGDTVAAGDVLAELRSPAFLTLQRDYLEALNAARLSRGELERDRQLHEEGLIPERRLRETETRASVAAASLSEHRELLRLGGLDEEALRALSARQQIQGAVPVRAPADGVVLAVLAVNGERAETMAPLYRMADLSTLWLELAVPQEQLGAVGVGMPVAVSGREAPVAEVTRLGQTVDPATQTVTVRALLNGPDHGLRPGQFLSARVLADCCELEGAPVLAVPAAAIVRSEEGSFLFVRTASGFEARPVEVTSGGAEMAYVRQGVTAGDRVAVTGVAALKALWSAAGDGGP